MMHQTDTKDSTKSSLSIGSMNFFLLIIVPFFAFLVMPTIYLMGALKPSIFSKISFTDAFLSNILIFVTLALFFTFCANFFIRKFNVNTPNNFDVNPIANLIIGGALFPIFFLHYHMALATSILLACTPLFLQIIYNIPVLKQITTAILAIGLIPPLLFILPTFILQRTLFPRTSFGEIFGYYLLSFLIFIISLSLINGLLFIVPTLKCVNKSQNARRDDNRREDNIKSFLISFLLNVRAPRR